FVSDVDADRLGLAEGAPVLVRSTHGELRALVHRAPIRPGNVQMFYPEGNVLLPGGRRDRSGVPDYNTTVELLPRSRAKWSSVLSRREPPPQRRQVPRQPAAGWAPTQSLGHRPARPLRKLEARAPLEAGSVLGGREQEAALAARGADVVGDRQFVRAVPGDHLDVIAHRNRSDAHVGHVPGADARSLRRP